MSFRAIHVMFLLTLSSAAASLFARNNPPRPPCVYPYTKFVYSGCYQDSVFSRSLPFQADLDFNNATVEQCTAYCKGNNYRYAGLQYHGQCFCGASVSSASAPEVECNLPCNGDNHQACGGEDRLSIYQDPTFPDADAIGVSSDYLSIGCFTEGTSGRSLDYSQWDYLNVSSMTTETCLNACGAKGYPFAGTEFGRECYCGVVLGNGTAVTSTDKCATACTGNSTQFCGGPDHLSLYVAKTLESTDPCEPPELSSTSSPSPTPTPTSSSTFKSTTAIKTTSSKCVGYHCPKSTTCKTPTPTPPKSTSKSTPKTTSSTSTRKTSVTSTRKSSTLKTTTMCKTTTKAKTTTTSTPKSTPKYTSTKKYGW
ncbi:WSC-domain-containing protein [Melanomma pulvis-pyrius CBS 109.77]|uniref:WSC-domain-containing protein n=1 Tax=Melanomma pulvis-pyrius CBS 109.77 TaxID=1314802 RepID=A0A6A6WS82_9PLEO|nr:WSC-domain-containing protein [Melanomma pulvis-pyrius CBS 109.77]